MRVCSLVIAVLLTATATLAHHSNAAFDGDKVVVLKGTVTQWKWSNPHVWIFLSVDDEKGGKADWAIEGRTPGQLVRAGWSRSSLKPGDVSPSTSARPRTAPAPASSPASGSRTAPCSDRPPAAQ